MTEWTKAFAWARDERRRSPSERLLESIADRLQADAAGLTECTGGECRRLSGHGVPDSFPCCRAQHRNAQCWRFPIPHRPKGRAHECTVWTSGGSHWLCARRINDHRQYPNVILARQSEHAPFSQTQARRLSATLTELLDHVRTGLEVADAQAQTEHFGQILSRLPLPLVLVNRELHVLAANRAAHAILQAADGLGLRNGCLSIGQAARDALLDEMGRANGDDTHVHVQRPSGRPPYVITVFAAERDDASAADSAALTIRDPGSILARPSNAVAKAFRLTPAEMRVAHLLACGHTPGTASDELCVSVSTVRTHINRLYAKTGTKRAPDLVRLVLGMTVGA